MVRSPNSRTPTAVDGGCLSPREPFVTDSEDEGITGTSRRATDPHRRRADRRTLGEN